MGTQGAGVGFEGSHSRGEHGIDRKGGRKRGQGRRSCYCNSLAFAFPFAFPSFLVEVHGPHLHSRPNLVCGLLRVRVRD